MAETKKTMNLEELKAKLYEAFDKAIDRANKYFDGGGDKTPCEMLASASEAAKALAAVERELRESKSSGYHKLDKN